MKRTATLTLVLVLVSAALSTGAGPNQGVVELLVTYQEYDPIMPWRKKQPQSRQGYGAVLPGGRILTTESLVRNHTFAEIRLAGTGRKIPVKVDISDWQVDLAVLRPRHPEALAGTVALEIAETVPRDEDLLIVQFDDTGQVQESRSQIVEVSVKPLPSPAAHSLLFTLLSDIQIKGNGAVVIYDGKLAGLVTRYNSGDRSADVLPYPLVRRFCEDTEQLPYKGFGVAGFSWAPLIDPVKRAFLGAEALNGGILVLSRVPGSGAAETLEEHDVIVEWDGFPIDERGYYEDPDFGTLSIPYLISGRRRPGEKAPVKVIRDGKVHEIGVRLTPYLDDSLLVPENITGEQEEYLVEGGIVLRELSGNYLRAYGSQWSRRVNPRLGHIYATRRLAPDHPGDRVVILSHVIPEQVNIGYQHLRDIPVTAVNGEPVRNMDDVFRIADRDGHVTGVSLQSIAVELALPSSEKIDDANQRIAQRYSISNLRHVKEPQQEEGQ
ncbi:MAG: hypothetical protein HQ559_06420 [Lentisphaerae bacterium]|nr:hypothetical protein [Lentisphaerota bacterium]